MIVVELSEALVELSPYSALLQVRHGQFVLLLNEGLENAKIDARDEISYVSSKETTPDFCKKLSRTIVSALSGSSSHA